MLTGSILKPSFPCQLWPALPAWLRREQVPIDLAAVLLAKEERVHLRESLQRPDHDLIGLNLNIPGPVKRTGLSDYFLAIWAQNVVDALGGAGFPVTDHRILSSPAGVYLLWEVEDPGTKRLSALKKLMVQLEESAEAGRLLDLDVFAPSGVKISRSGAARTCLLCDREAFLCARSRRHTLTSLLSRARTLMFDYLQDRYQQDLLAASLRAMRQEVRLTPKPGLVDLANNGSHADMDYHSFERSMAALMPFFASYLELARNFIEEAADSDRAPRPVWSDLFPDLRQVGLEAEHAALAVNHGVNCQLGLNYAFSLLLPSALFAFTNGLLWLEGLCPHFGREGQDHFWPRSGDIAVGVAALVQPNYQEWRQEHPTRPGGARQMAANGYHLITDTILPGLVQRLRAGVDPEVAFLLTFLQLLTQNEDTNILRRGGCEALREVQTKARTIFEQEAVDPDVNKLLQAMTAFDKELIKRHLSPGGTADLLAITFFLYHMESLGKASGLC